MARKITVQALDSREARRRLKPRARPYYQALTRELHLGYRRTKKGAGSWSSRLRTSAGYSERHIGDADDQTGVGIDFWKACEAARARAPEGSPLLTERVGPYRVRDVVADYVAHLELHKKSAYDVRKRQDANTLPVLGNIEVADLTSDKLRKWHAGLVKQGARLRTRPGEEQRFREAPTSDEAKRRRQVSANRCLQQLKAALNLAYREEKVRSDQAWKKVQIFVGVESARVRYLTVAECKRLLAACEDKAFRKLVRAGLETGARYGELCRLTVSDYYSDVGTLAVRISKTAKPRHVVLTDDGRRFFERLCRGRNDSNVPMLLKSDGSEWNKSHQIRPMKEACQRAAIKPAMGFHGLRHTWASLAVMAGVPLFVVAKNLGHSDTRMVEKHYGHLAPSYVADVIRKHAPRFGKVAY